jgi:hypothetical protein
LPIPEAPPVFADPRSTSGDDGNLEKSAVFLGFLTDDYSASPGCDARTARHSMAKTMRRRAMMHCRAVTPLPRVASQLSNLSPLDRHEPRENGRLTLEAGGSAR